MDENFGLGRLGGSLKVDNVQALAAKLSSEIPNRYVRPERKADIVAGDHEVSDESIPVIDFGKLFDSEFSEEEAAKLHSACEDWGFFQLVNHGISQDVISKLRHDIEEFFKLPLEEKENFAQLPRQIEGYGQAFVQSEEQKLDWGDMLFLATLPPNIKQLQFWPTNPPSCRKTFDEYAIEVKRVADNLFKMISKNLGLGFEKFYEIFKGGRQSLRFNYYPPCPCPEKVLGLSPHSDAVGLTLLLQISEVEGLQIRRNGGWLHVKALPGALIVNIGDAIELLNHGISQDVINKLKHDIEEFFKLPLEEKENFAQLPGQIEGYGQAFVQSEEQKLDWGDMLFLATFPPNIKQLQFWPTNPPSCRKTLDEYAIEVKRVADNLLKMISKNLGHGFEKLYEMFKGGMQSLRFNYYPPCPCPEKVLGLSPHSDAVGLTLLLQISEVQGLEIRRNGGWLHVKALPGAFIVNIGDTIEILCNGKYKSIEHRAVVNSEKERLSVAAFHTLNIGDVVGPMPDISKRDKLLYKSLPFEEYGKLIFASKLEGKSILDRMKLDE